MHLRSRCADTIFFETHVTRINEALACRQGMMPEICHHFGAQTKSPLQECGPDYSLQMVWIGAHYIHVYFAGSQHVFHSERPRRTSAERGGGGGGGGRKSLRIKVFSDLLVTVICLSHAFKRAAFNVQLRVSHGRKDRVTETGGCFYTTFGGPAALLPRKLSQRCLACYSPEVVEASLLLPWNNLFFLFLIPIAGTNSDESRMTAAEHFER